MKIRVSHVALVILVFALESAHGQFPRIPDIKKVEINTPARPGANNPTSNTKSTATADWTQSREMVMDDGFTYFDAAPATEYSAASLGQIDIGWYLKSSLRLLGTFPNRSGFNVVVTKAGKELAKTRCEAKPYRKSDDMNLSTPESRAGKDLSFD